MKNLDVKLNLFEEDYVIEIEHLFELDWLTRKINSVLSEMPGAQHYSCDDCTQVRLSNIEQYKIAYNEIVNAIVVKEVYNVTFG